MMIIRLLTYKQEGHAGLMDRSRAPKQVHHRTHDEIEKLITAERRKHPTWGPKKIHVINWGQSKIGSQKLGSVKNSCAFGSFW